MGNNVSDNLKGNDTGIYFVNIYRILCCCTEMRKKFKSPSGHVVFFIAVNTNMKIQNHFN